MKTLEGILLFKVTLLFVLPNGIYGQVSDVGLWTNVSVEKNFTQSFSSKFNQEFRFNENITELGSFFSELGFTYKMVPAVGITGNYRYTQRRGLDDSYLPRHGYNIDLDYKPKIKRIAIGLRARFQSKYSERLFTTTELLVPDNYARGKITLKYVPEERYKPFVSGEIFYQLNNPEGNEIDNYRVSAGFDYELNKYSSLQFFYLFQQEVNVKNPHRDYVAGIGYNFSF